MKKKIWMPLAALAVLLAVPYFIYGTITPCGIAKRQMMSEFGGLLMGGPAKDSPIIQGLSAFLGPTLIDRQFETMSPLDCIKVLVKLNSEEMDEVRDQIASGGPASAKSADKMSEIESAYLEQVAVQRVRVSKDTLGRPGVFGEIKNKGAKSLKKVEITIYFLDKKKKAIHEKTYHPVLVSKYAFGGDNTPLKPGYARKFGYKADDAPSGWSRRVKVAVTEVEFDG